MCLHPGGAFPNPGSAMEMQIVLMAMMSDRIARGDLALKMISPVVMDSVFQIRTGTLGVQKFPNISQTFVGITLLYLLDIVVTEPIAHGPFSGL